MEGTRLRILQQLQRNSNDTVDGLSREIGLAPATIRRHLDILQRDRLVAFKEVRKKTGRPEYSFYLTDEGQETLPKSYDQLLGMMISELGSLSVEQTSNKDGQEIVELVFQRLSENVWDQHKNLVDGAQFDQRIEALMGVLTDDEFYPEYEIVDGQMRLFLMNCPFRSVALQNTAVCSYDSNVITAMLGTKVEREACISNGDGCCLYTAQISTS